VSRSISRPTALSFGISLSLTLVLLAANTLAWSWSARPIWAPSWEGKVGGVAYSGFRTGQDPTQGRFPSDAELEEDMRILAGFTDRIRTYSAIENGQVPAIAATYGLRVTAGAWLDAREENNRRELAALVTEARANRAVDQVMVGNEVLLRNDLPVAQMINHIRDVRAKVKKPVSTAEPWHIWMKYPTLARTVDFITVHLLPYWEGVPAAAAVDYALSRLDELQRAYPRKRIVIGEIGWPSHGDRRDAARATVEQQAQFVRLFLANAGARGLDYFFMEAFDQPWKAAHEGRAGAYWGLFNADRTPKFPLAGPILRDPHWTTKAALSAAIAAPIMLWFGLRFRRMRWQGLLVFGALVQACAALAVWIVTVPLGFYLGPIDWTMLALLLPALAATIAILLVQGFELVEVLWGGGWRRAFAPIRDAAPEGQPFVSIHLPCHNEPPEMVLVTLRSLAALDYASYEVLVVDNNTRDPAVWRPVEEWCAQAGERFRFVHLDDWPGFKAGALNYALRVTDPRAEVIGVVDADYVVEPDWLRTLVPHFADARVGVVQAPQAHRDFEKSAFQRMCNWEFEGFFRVGMHHRNERNAIIQHGTMTLVRRTALAADGGWAEWCICEDAELGLRLMHAGWDVRYVDEVLGRGLTPADFAAFKVQRFRWAFGGMQILRRRLGWLAGRSPLTTGQRFHFLTGWSTWFADALHLGFTLLVLGWTLGMVAAPRYFHAPLLLFVLPVALFLVAKVLFGPILYRARVKCSWLDVIGASVASMGLSHAIARGVLAGLTRRKGTFVRTNKAGRRASWLRAFAPAREEAVIALGLAAAIAAMVYTRGTHNLEGMLWVGVLTAQMLPYLATIVCAGISARSASHPVLAAAAAARPVARAGVPAGQLATQRA
jgi:exo-beta-1,3-glucanase (GH17 family)/cellulose synthase/poly-beta-1,6-N-acetylglucosamine synthase-like glycosyltransferase